MSRLRTRRVTIALCIVALAFALSISSAGVLPLFSFVKLAPASQRSSSGVPPGGQVQPPQTGTLVVRASLFGTPGSQGLVTGALVSVDGVGSGSAQQTMTTNSTGEVQVTLTTGNYSVRISSPEFNTTTAAQVYQDRVTEVDLVANGVDLPSVPVVLNSGHPLESTDQTLQLATSAGALLDGQMQPAYYGETR